MASVYRGKMVELCYSMSVGQVEFLKVADQAAVKSVRSRVSDCGKKLKRKFKVSSLNGVAKVERTK
jgi:hypothetical protein